MGWNVQPPTSELVDDVGRVFHPSLSCTISNFQWHDRPASQMRMRRFLSPERVASPVPAEEQARFIFCVVSICQDWKWYHVFFSKFCCNFGCIGELCCGWVFICYLDKLHDTRSLRDQSKWHLSTKKKTNSGYIVHAFSMFNSLLQIRSIRRLPRRSNLLQITSWHMSIQNHQELSCVDMSLEAMKHSSELLQIAKGNGSYSVSFSNSTWTHVKCVWIVTGLRRSFRCDSFIKFIQVQASFDQAVCHGIWEHLTEAWWTAQACVAQKEDHSAP